MTGTACDFQVAVTAIDGQMHVTINGETLSTYGTKGDDRLGQDLVREIHARLEGPTVVSASDVVRICPSCERDITGRVIGVQYGSEVRDHYDGVSEWRCPDCKARWGRWTRNLLAVGETEPPFGISRAGSPSGETQ